MNNKVTILAVDDEPDILYTLRAIGARMNWSVYCETCSRSVLERVNTLKPDLILLDYHMPQKDGLTLLKGIRKINKVVPVIILTVDERQDIADRFLDAGASDFANKPIKVPDLAARINIHIQIIQRQAELKESYIVSKGISRGTLNIILNFCQINSGWFFIEEVVDSTGLAYQTVVRYLQYLINEKELIVKCDYGKVGRPRNKYKFVNNLRE